MIKMIKVILLGVFCWSWVLPLYAQAAWADPLLAKVYKEELDLSQWWVSEKLDGVRAIWDGQQLRFRSGRVIQAPAWYTQDFPAQPMDGELWMGRGTFEQTSAAVRRKQPQDEPWRRIHYRLFELPAAKGTFTQRVEQMQSLTHQLQISWLQPIPQQRVSNREALFRWLERVVEEGGEGLMLHRADSLYHGGRSGDLLKLKAWQDAEATVVEIMPGQGKYRGMMGALRVEDAQGRQFRIGSGFSDQERQNPPALGSLITYKYTGTTGRGLPRFASFLRLRQGPE
ncbi:MAG: DNA ligase [Gammaproteobacteria bacterium]|jgi:DNA ligase-1|nr:DNA ligase [Gammaproteobacteria bacterium]MBT4608116.1 DNA ligase [Thiotrichales bacterium]MBT3472777.1 DNA ligase [Gammaproteobacteria bacterium]MBT3968426.1 DNA ligase [Gammaproteobacteria bacterium]MBT4080150.1 DNA ligase [Gammaproteobacteria bacterium]